MWREDDEFPGQVLHEGLEDFGAYPESSPQATEPRLWGAGGGNKPTISSCEDLTYNKHQIPSSFSQRRWSWCKDGDFV